VDQNFWVEEFNGSTDLGRDPWVPVTSVTVMTALYPSSQLNTTAIADTTNVSSYLNASYPAGMNILYLNCNQSVALGGVGQPSNASEGVRGLAGSSTVAANYTDAVIAVAISGVIDSRSSGTFNSTLLFASSQFMTTLGGVIQNLSPRFFISTGGSLDFILLGMQYDVGNQWTSTYPAVIAIYYEINGLNEEFWTGAS
jgi:hypothetical protein